jgi:hypothetical protein
VVWTIGNDVNISTYLADKFGVSFQSDGEKLTGKLVITLARLTENLDDPMTYISYLANPDEADEIADMIKRKAQEIRDELGT